MTVLGKGKRPLEVSLDLPDGEYVVEAAGVRMAPMPRWFGFGHWRRQSFLEDEPDVFTALGSARAENGELTVSLPASAATGVHVLGLRVRPAELRTQEAGAAVDAEQERRLRALGYVQ